MNYPSIQVTQVNRERGGSQGTLAGLALLVHGET